MTEFCHYFLIRLTAGPVNYHSRFSAGVLPVVDNNLPVDQDIIDPARKNEWMLVGGVILYLVVIKYDDVGKAAFFDQAS